MKLPKFKFKMSGQLALITGLTMGLLAAAAQGFFRVQPPVGEGICFISHPANLINWFSNNLFSTEFTMHAIFVQVPVLTSVGAVIGSLAAAIKNREFRFRRGPVRDTVLAFIFGFLVINFGLLWGACPIRTAVLSSYGMVWAMLNLLVIVLGVIAASQYIKWKVRRM